jgi:hypothetical protein
MGMLNMDTTAVGEESERVLEQLDLECPPGNILMYTMCQLWDLLRLQLWMNPLNKALIEFSFF